MITFIAYMWFIEDYVWLPFTLVLDVAVLAYLGSNNKHNDHWD